MSKSRQNRIGLTVVAAVLGTVVSSGAMAASKALCEDYAQLAVSQYDTMQTMDLGCSGFRWHNWYDGHYHWCRSTSKASAQSEMSARKSALLNGQC